MFTFGNWERLTPPESTQKKVDKIKKVFAATQEKTEKTLIEYQELAKFTNELSKSYINNLHVIIDIRGLLSTYNDLLDHILSHLNTFDETLNNGLNNQDIIELKNLTLDKLEEVKQTFNKNLSTVSNALTNPDLLKEVDLNIVNTQQKLKR